MQAVEKPLKIPEVPETQDKVMTICNSAMPPMDCIGSKSISSTTITITIIYFI